MKGLELSKAFYIEQVQPMLMEKFPQLFSRMAIGLVGEGSQCFGFDDNLSQDHDWGGIIILTRLGDGHAAFCQLFFADIFRISQKQFPTNGTEFIQGISKNFSIGRSGQMMRRNI